MVKRLFWINLIERLWRERNVIWLAGVRRAGKTCLCQSLPNAEYFDCELPRVRRLLYGGLPPFFLSDAVPERDFQEWMDAYWAKDIQELFRLERRHSFQRFAELLWARSGGLFEATRFAGPCEVSRTTIRNYLAVLEATYVAHVVRAFGAKTSVEIVAAPKVYGFDTGFVVYHRGWRQLRMEERGSLWERAFRRSWGEVELEFVNLADLISRLKEECHE